MRTNLRYRVFGILRRILILLLVVWTVVSLVTLLIELVPGDPAVAVLGEQATPEQFAQFREKHGLDRPPFFFSFPQDANGERHFVWHGNDNRYVDYWRALLHGDMMMLDRWGFVKSAMPRTRNDESVFEISSEDLAGSYPVVRYGPPDPETLTIDLIGRLGEAFSFDDIEAVPVDVGDLTAQVATPRMLYVMKRDTVRPQDRADAQVLRDTFGLEE